MFEDVPVGQQGVVHQHMLFKAHSESCRNTIPTSMLADGATQGLCSYREHRKFVDIRHSFQHQQQHLSTQHLPMSKSFFCTTGSMCHGTDDTPAVVIIPRLSRLNKAIRIHSELPAHVFSSQRQTSGRPTVPTSTKLRRNGWRRRYSPCNTQQSPSIPDERNT